MKFLTKNNYSFPLHLCGCDEVGRGPLAGPVVAATVSVQVENEEALKGFVRLLKKLKVTDSKMLKAEDRQIILGKLGIEWGTLKTKIAYVIEHKGFQFRFAIEEIDNSEIDQINILQASLKAMKTSFELLAKEKNVVLIDGNKKFQTDKNADLFPIVKGDATSVVIGLASIIAKEYRDALMMKFHEVYPAYGFITNMGYPSVIHRQSLKDNGPTPIHRLSFRGVLNTEENLSLSEIDS